MNMKMNESFMQMQKKQSVRCIGLHCDRDCEQMANWNENESENEAKWKWKSSKYKRAKESTRAFNWFLTMPLSELCILVEVENNLFYNVTFSFSCVVIHWFLLKEDDG